MNDKKIFEHLSTPLPPELGGRSNAEQEENTVSQVKDLLKKYVPASDQKEIEAEFNKNVPLSKQAKKKWKRPQMIKKGKYLTAREKRDLRLSKLDKNSSLKYENFKKIHFLWKDYMREIIGKISGAGPLCSSSEGRISAILDENLQLKICRADLHGSVLKVTRALNSCLVGLQGIVVMETKHTFQMIDKKNVLRIIPKQGTCFTFALDQLVLTFSGSSFIMKPSERAVKRWKRRPTLEL